MSIPLSKKSIQAYLDAEIRKYEKAAVVEGDFEMHQRVYALQDVREQLIGRMLFNNHDSITVARMLRMTITRHWLKIGLVKDKEAREKLSGPLSLGDASTIVDDSALLDDPDVFEKIEKDNKGAR